MANPSARAFAEQCARAQTWTAYHVNGLQCTISYLDLVDLRARVGLTTPLRSDAVEEAVGDWTCIRNLVLVPERSAA